MLSQSLIRIGDSRLSVEAVSIDPCIVGSFRGIADHTALTTLLEATDLLVTAPQARLVLDLQELQEATAWCAGTVARMIREGHRMGKEVYLVRCPGWFYEQLETNGLNGPVRHAGSLAAATDGLLGIAQSTLSLCLRSAPENLRRLRAVLNVVAARLLLSEEEQYQVQTAVGEACTNAITHGSPMKLRNQVLVSFHLNADALIIDVADEGPGFDPNSIPAPRAEDMLEHGYGIHLMRQLMDRLEYFRDSGGTVVRLTKLLPRPVAQ